jgi:hypothetical protein
VIPSALDAHLSIRSFEEISATYAEHAAKKKPHAVSTAAFAMRVIFVGFTALKWRSL